MWVHTCVCEAEARVQLGCFSSGPVSLFFFFFSLGPGALGTSETVLLLPPQCWYCKGMAPCLVFKMTAGGLNSGPSCPLVLDIRVLHLSPGWRQSLRMRADWQTGSYDWPFSWRPSEALGLGDRNSCPHQLQKAWIVFSHLKCGLN